MTYKSQENIIVRDTISYLSTFISIHGLFVFSKVEVWAVPVNRFLPLQSHVSRLKKALYGLKQAPRAWYSRIDSYCRWVFKRVRLIQISISSWLEMIRSFFCYMWMICLSQVRRDLLQFAREILLQSMRWLTLGWCIIFWDQRFGKSLVIFSWGKESMQ